MTREGTRRLAAVWFADVVGYTALSARDESLALRVVRELQRIARMQCDARGGRVVKLLGDAVLAVFDNADGAVRAAVGLRDAFLQSPEAKAAGVSLRVGLHLGDVTEAVDGDVYGDAVNGASRIEGIAKPGQVVISAVAYMLLQQRATLQVEDLGEEDLKGLGPVRLYAASISGETDAADLRELLQAELAPLQLLDAAGLGGMGEIYLARDPRLRRTLAVKVLRSELVADKQARARFTREAQVIAGLSHPNVISIHTVGELKDGTPYFVMDYVEGGSLADRLARDGPLSVPEARRILGEVASALQAAHAKGIIHRDIKPGNVLWDAETGRALVTDWGIAALDATQELEPEARLTSTGMFVGSPQYMSPEQLSGDEIGPEVDIYAWGLLAFELLAGRGPFSAETPRGVMIAHLREDPPKLSTLRDDVDPELDELVMRALSKVARERPTAEDLSRRLAPGSDALLEWPPPGLEGLRGKVMSVAGWWSLSALLWLPILTTGLIAAVGADPASPSAAPASYSTLSAILAAAGAVAFAWGLVRFAVAGYHLEAGRALGYGFGTLAEVAADRRGDTGMLIVGGREYVSLSPEERWRLRRNRLIAATLFVAAPLLAFLMVAASIPLAGHGYLAARTILVLTLGLPAGTAIAGLIVADRETRRTMAFRKALRRHRTPRAALRGLVDPWYSVLESIRAGTALGRGRKPNRWVAVAAILVLGAVTAGLAASLFSLVVLTAAGGTAGQYMRVAGTRNYSIMHARLADLRTAASVRLAVDSSVTPEDAADLLFRITQHQRDSDPEVSRALAQAIANSPLVNGGGPMGSCYGGRCSSYPLVVDSLVPVAFRGLTPAEQEYLRYTSTEAIPPEWGKFAKAGLYHDFASLVLEFGTEAAERPWPETPYPRFSILRETWYWSRARAALLISEGRLADAEQMLRESLSVGLVLAEGSTMASGATLGAFIASGALTDLRLFYTLAGRTDEAAKLNAGSASGSLESEARSGQSRHPWQLVTDSTEIPQFRWESIPGLRIELMCGTLRGILFGVPQEVDDYLRGPLRSQLVRTERQGRYFDSFFSLEERLAPSFDRLVTGIDLSSPLTDSIWWVGRLLGSRRLQLCSNMMAIGRIF